MMAACSTDDIAQLINGDKKNFTATLAAPGSGGTRTILKEDNNKITVKWAEGDEIALVHNGVKDVATVKSVDATTGQATISGTLTGTVNNNDPVELIYPAAYVSGVNSSDPIYDDSKLLTQGGTLDYIQKNLDFRQATGQLSVNGSEVTLNSAVKLESDIAIWKLTLKQQVEEQPVALAATQVKIMGGTKVLASTATLATATSEVTLAMPTNLSVVGALTIEATDGEDTYTYTKTEGVTFTANTYYQNEVTLTKAGWAANEYNEASLDGTKVVFTKQTAASDPTVVADANADVTWGDGWYTVSGNVTITGNVTLDADTHLILQDGATLTINGQLDSRTNGKNLNIYGQDKGDGKLNVSYSDDMNGTAIYGDVGTILKIHGGEITAAAIGDTGMGLEIDHFKMYGGKLTSTSKNNPGIQFTRDFEVYGGEVVGTTNSTSYPSNGIYGINGSLIVYGGKVKATGNGINDTEYGDYGSGFGCKVQSGTTGIKFYFSDNGTTWDSGTYYEAARTAPTNRYAKAE